MGSKTRVSKLTRVVQGKTSVIFELTDKGLTIECSDTGKGSGFSRFTLRMPGVDALKELLNGGLVGYTIPKLPTHLPGSDEVERRLTREPAAAPDRPMSEEEAEGQGLVRQADKTESGMD